ncbi:hypothetical protein CDD82_5850 [Ophiocordyceps australis]|uniref:Uncharacterized protein n=1 Tax=Ophiocordyceps australis TaxID=1399860 RepID=A0A2C5YYI3_9HYPO|nr:hypothetical protein CDD82_5850 [Ophiocordyceps australis]
MYPSSNSKDSATTDRCVVVVCLGNNPLNIDTNIKDLVTAVAAHHEQVSFLVADGLYNLEQLIPKRTSPSAAKRMALKAGDAMENAIRRVNEAWILSNDVSAEPFSISRWAAVKDETFDKVFDLAAKYRNRFEHQFRSASEYYIWHRLHINKVDNRRLEIFTQYILEELPVQLLGAQLHGERYSQIYQPVYLQPSQDPMSDLEKTYYSPILDLVEAYRNDAEFMREMADLAPGVPLPRLTRLFFDRPMAQD